MTLLIDKLFGDIGKRIQNHAAWFGIITFFCGIIASIILVFLAFSEEFLWWIALSTFAGSYLCLQISRLFYGFGQMVDDIQAIRYGATRETSGGSAPKVLSKKETSTSVDFEISKYLNLYNKGIITREEFIAKKESLLNSGR